MTTPVKPVRPDLQRYQTVADINSPFPLAITSRTILAQKWKFNPAQRSIHVQAPLVIVGVLNTTRGVWIYNPADPAATNTRIDDGHVDLVYDTTGMSSEDDLQVFCEEIPEPVPTTLEQILHQLQLQTAILSTAMEVDRDLLEIEENEYGN